MPKISIFAPILTGIIDAWDSHAKNGRPGPKIMISAHFLTRMLDAWDSF